MDRRAVREGKRPVIESSPPSDESRAPAREQILQPRGGEVIRGTSGERERTSNLLPPAGATSDRQIAPISTITPDPAGPDGITSTMTPEDVEALRVMYRIPDFIHLSAPGPNDRVTSVLPGRVALYEEFLRCGLRLPLHPFFLNLLSRYMLVPAQLTPNSIRIFCAFVVLCHFQGSPGSLSLFRALFKLRRQGREAWWVFTARPGRALPLGLPSKVKGWKPRFFFAHIEGVRTEWGEPDTSSNGNSAVSERDGELFRHFSNSQIPSYKELLSEENLLEAELAPAVAMKVTPEMLEAALRRKRLAAGERAGPAKRGRGEDRGGAAAVLANTGASSSVAEPTREDWAGRAVPPPAEVAGEEGEMVLVDLDPEGETQAAAEPTEAEGAEVATDPHAATESGAERTYPPVGAEAREVERRGAETVRTEGIVAERGRQGMARVAGARAEKGRPGKTQAEAERRPAEARRSSRRGAEAGGSSCRPPRRPAQLPPDELPGGPARLPPQLRSMSDAGVATTLLARTRTAASDAEVRGQTPAALLDVAVVNTLQLANVIFGLEGSLSASADAMSRAMARLERYKTQNRSLSEELARLRDENKAREDEAKAREEALKGRVREAECQVQIECTRASAAEAKSTLLASRLEAADLRTGDLAGQVRHLEGRLDETYEEIRVAVEKVAAAEEAAAAADTERAKEAARVAEAETRAAEAETRAAEANARSLEADGKVREAELRSAAAVAEYKASADFVSEVVEASLGAYTAGFDLCKTKVSAAFNLSGPELDLIQAGETGEDETAEEGEAEEVAAAAGEAEEAEERPGPSGV